MSKRHQPPRTSQQTGCEPGTLVWDKTHGLGFACGVGGVGLDPCSVTFRVDASQHDEPWLDETAPRIPLYFPDADVRADVEEAEVVENPGRHQEDALRMVRAADDPTVTAIKHDHHVILRAQMPRTVEILHAIQRWKVWGETGPRLHLWEVILAYQALTRGSTKSHWSPALAIGEAEKVLSLLDSSPSLLGRMLGNAARQDLLLLARARLSTECETLLEKLRAAKARAATPKGAARALAQFEAGAAEIRRRYSGLGLDEYAQRLQRFDGSFAERGGSDA